MPTDIKSYEIKYGGVGKYKSPASYAPFKMKAADHGNSPMKKNFPNDIASPNKFAFLPGMMPGMSGPGGLAGVGARVQQDMARFNRAKGAMGKRRVPPHGDEAHTGGGGAVGGDEVATDAAVEEGGGGGGIGQQMMDMINPMKGGAVGAGLRAGKAALGGLKKWFSDSRLKEKIQRTGNSPSGIPIYEFNYIGDTNRYSGAMAQDLLEINTDAVSMDASGYYKVNYDNIDVDMHLIN